jgi:hypothetical protein
MTMGETLFCRLDVQAQLVAYPGLFRASIRYEHPDQPGVAFRWWSDLLFVQSELPAAAEMKGIGYNYRIYTLATQPQINGIWHRGHDHGDLLLAPTLERFPLEMRDKLKAVQQRTENNDNSECNSE